MSQRRHCSRPGVLKCTSCNLFARFRLSGHPYFSCVQLNLSARLHELNSTGLASWKGTVYMWLFSLRSIFIEQGLKGFWSTFVLGAYFRKLSSNTRAQHGPPASTCWHNHVSRVVSPSLQWLCSWINLQLVQLACSSRMLGWLLHVQGYREQARL